MPLRQRQEDKALLPTRRPIKVTDIRFSCAGLEVI